MEVGGHEDFRAIDAALQEMLEDATEKTSAI
jgi:hypothetical protein